MSYLAGGLAIALGLAHVANSIAWLRRGSLGDPAMLQIPIGLVPCSDSEAWALVQGMAIYNGLKAFGSLRWSHHIVRFLLFGAVFTLALFS